MLRHAFGAEPASSAGTAAQQSASLSATEVLSIGSACTIGTATPHGGSQYVVVPATSAGPIVRLGSSTSTSVNISSGTVVTSGYFRLASAGGADRTVLQIATAAGTALASVRYIFSTQVLQLDKLAAPTSQDIGTVPFATATWYRVVLECFISNSVGTLLAKFYEGDSTTLFESLSLSGLDTDIGGIGHFSWALSATSSMTMLIDDCMVLDSVNNGDGFTEDVGPYQINMQKPVTVSVAAWKDSLDGSGSPGGGDTNALHLDEMPAAAVDDDTTAISCAETTALLDRYNITSLPVGVPSDATMLGMYIGGRIASNTTTSNNGRWIARFAPDTFNGPDLNFNTNGWEKSLPLENLVVNLRSYTKQNANDFQIGVENSTPSAQLKKVTAMWANTIWGPAPEEPEPPPATDLIAPGVIINPLRW